MVSRRAALRQAALALGGAVVGGGAVETASWLAHRHLPLSGGYAPAADELGAVRSSSTEVTYYVETTEPVVAFTFDDGPGPKWTPMVLDVLDAHQVPATFFLVGSNVKRHGDLLRGRLDRHDVGNHSWSHPDFAQLDLARVHDELQRTQAAIATTTGRTPRLMRPPYGHLGGATVLAANAVGCDVVLWSQQMRELKYVRDPAGQARDIVDNARPGAIILAHDVGKAQRLVALRQLSAMFDGLRARGFRFATVSELMSLGAPRGAAVPEPRGAAVPEPRGSAVPGPQGQTGH
jgi:peptidoglycan/xylan/chitin deacetylase (PgdA/CDA1 family)